MELICLGSSSSGNCYLFKAAEETLIVECGIDVKEIKKALGWSLRGVVGCLVSHSHTDHAKHIVEVMRNGIPVYALEEVFKDVRNRAYIRPVTPLKGYKVGGYKVVPIPLAHDVPCIGFIIEHEEMGRTLFITDTMMCSHQVKGLDHIMIEANYSDDILQENIDNGVVPHSLRDRLMGSHMELGTTLDYLRQCDMTSVEDIVLLHLSANNSNLTEFKRKVEELTARPCYVAQKGLRIDFTTMPF